MGYTPVFDSVYRGTLCGKFPALPVWMTILPLADRHGVIDLTPEAISAITGWPLELLLQGIAELEKPDPRSRSNAEEGRRLVRLDPDRDWGWRVVNHDRYREKARKAAYDSARTASGLDAARKAVDREVSRGVPRCPAPSRSQTQTETKTKTLREDCTAAAPPSKASDPEWFTDFRSLYPKRSGDPNWRGALRAGEARLREGHLPSDLISGARRYAAYCEATGKTGTEYVKQASSFLGPSKPFLLDWTPPATVADRRLANNINAAQEFLRNTDPKVRAA